MLRKFVVVTFVALVVLLMAYTPAAAKAEPTDGCPDGFSRHSAIHHHSGGDHHGNHKHVGTDIDRNGDGYICGKHVGVDGSVHVHIDNNRR